MRRHEGWTGEVSVLARLLLKVVRTNELMTADLHVSGNMETCRALLKSVESALYK